MHHLPLKCRYHATVCVLLLHEIHILYFQAISAMRLRQEMCHYLEWRMKKITRDNVSTLMQKLLGPHLGWVIVWGCLLGTVTGAVSQALRISLSFNYKTTNVN